LKRSSDSGSDTSSLSLLVCVLDMGNQPNLTVCDANCFRISLLRRLPKVGVTQLDGKRIYESVFVVFVTENT